MRDHDTGIWGILGLAIGAALGSFAKGCGLAVGAVFALWLMGVLP